MSFLTAVSVLTTISFYANAKPLANDADEYRTLIYLSLMTMEMTMRYSSCRADESPHYFTQP